MGAGQFFWLLSRHARFSPFRHNWGDGGAAPGPYGLHPLQEIFWNCFHRKISFNIMSQQSRQFFTRNFVFITQRVPQNAADVKEEDNPLWGKNTWCRKLGDALKSLQLSSSTLSSLSSSALSSSSPSYCHHQQDRCDSKKRHVHSAGHWAVLSCKQQIEHHLHSVWFNCTPIQIKKTLARWCYQ